MNCLVCGASPTIRSHLIPRVMAVEVQVGVAHAVTSPSTKDFQQSQSGHVDRNILCSSCDSSIGLFEGSTARAFRSLRTAGMGAQDGVLVTADQSSDVALRFYAALLWKYSVTRRDLGQINLGPYRSELEKIAFKGAPIQAFFDAALFRLRLAPNDDSIFAYRAPILDRQDGLNVYRVLAGGVLAIIKVDRRPWGDTPLKSISLGRGTYTRALVMAAQGFEEFQIPQHLVHSQSRLSAFLDRQDARASQKA